jgi:hypothetical protein
MTDESAALPATQPERRPDIVAGAKVLPLVPRNIDEVLRYARMIMVAGAVPDALLKENGQRLPDNEIVARVVAVIAAGSEIGMGPMSSMANIALINKRRLIWGQGAVAVLQASGQLEDMRVERLGQQPGDAIQTAQFADSFGVKVILKRKGQSTPFTGEFTVGQAKRAHLWMNTNKKPWIEHPERMLFWRAFNNAANTGFGDCLSGLSIREVFDEPLAAPQITDTSFLDAPARADPLAEPPAEPSVPAPPLEPADGRVSDGPPFVETAPRRRRRRTREEIANDMFRPDPPTVQREPGELEPDEEPDTENDER